MLLFWKRVSGKWFALNHFILLLFLLLVLLLFLSNTEMHQHVKFTEQVPNCWFPVQFLSPCLKVFVPKGREEGESSRVEVVIRNPKHPVKLRGYPEPQMVSIFQHFVSNSRMHRNLWIKGVCGSLSLERRTEDGTKPMLKATELMNMNRGLEENEAQGFMDLVMV